MSLIYKKSSNLLKLSEYRSILFNPDQNFLIRGLNIPQSNSIYLIQHEDSSTIRKTTTKLQFEEDSRYNYQGKLIGLARTSYNLKYKEGEKVIETSEFKMINFHLLNSKNNISVVHFLGNIEKFLNYLNFKIGPSSKTIRNNIRSTIENNPLMSNSHVYLMHKSQNVKSKINSQDIKDNKQQSSSSLNLLDILDDNDKNKDIFNLSALNISNDNSKESESNTSKTSKSSSDLNETFQPRNKNQIKMIRKSMIKRTKVFAEGILNSWLFDEIGPEFIQEFKIKPNLEIILVHKGSLELATRLMNKSKLLMQIETLWLNIKILIFILGLKEENPFVINYDTTYKLTNYYVSMISFRNTEIVGNPVVVAAYFIHEVRSKKSHLNFWNFLVDLDGLKWHKHVIVVSDRESGIISAIKECFKLHGIESILIFCKIHIKNDVKYWLSLKLKRLDKKDKELNQNKLKLDSESDSDKDDEQDFDANNELKNKIIIRKILIDEIEEAQEKHGSRLNRKIAKIKSKSEIENYKNQVKEFKKDVNLILDLKTESEINNKVDHLKSNWPEACLDYLNSCILPALFNNLNLQTEIENLDELIVLDNNPAESINASVKRFANFKTLPLDNLILLLYNYSNTQIDEFNRACKGYGDYKLKDPKNSKLLKLTTKFIMDYESDLILFKKQFVMRNKAPDFSSFITQTQIAEFIVKKEMIIPFKIKELTGYLIANPFFNRLKKDNKKKESPVFFVHSVNSKLNCSCKYNNCHHIIAAELFINNQFDYKSANSLANLNISDTFTRSKLGRKRGRGQKRAVKKSELNEGINISQDQNRDSIEDASQQIETTKNAINECNKFDSILDNEQKESPLSICDDLQFSTIKIKDELLLNSVKSNSKENLNSIQHEKKSKSKKPKKRSTRCKALRNNHNVKYDKNEINLFDLLVNEMEDEIANDKPVESLQINETFEIDPTVAEILVDKEKINNSEINRLIQIARQQFPEPKTNWYNCTIINNYFYHLDKHNHLDSFLYIEPRLFNDLYLVHLKLNYLKDKDYDQIIIPTNLQSCHWLLCFISINSSKIILLDSMTSGKNIYLPLFQKLKTILIMYKVLRGIDLNYNEISCFICSDYDQQEITDIITCGPRTCFSIYRITTLDFDQQYDDNFKEKVAQSLEQLDEVEEISFYSKTDLKYKENETLLEYLKPSFINNLSVNIEFIEMNRFFNF